MAFEFRPGEHVQHEVRCIARQRASKAIRAIELADQSGIASAVHEARRRCKQIRALLRLVRPSLREYDTENVAVRDAARLLSPLRDAKTNVDTFDRLAVSCGLDSDRFGLIRAKLIQDHSQQTRAADNLLADFVIAMQGLRRRAKAWNIRGSGFGALQGGLEGTYEKCRRTMSEATRQPTAESLHEWRKQVKYNRAQLRLLRGLWPEIIEPIREQGRLLADALGFDHDLAVLVDALEAMRDDVDANVQPIQQLYEHALSTQRGLRAEALRIGPVLYAQRPRDFGRHAKQLWLQWDVPAG